MTVKVEQRLLMSLLLMPVNRLEAEALKVPLAAVQVQKLCLCVVVSPQSVPALDDVQRNRGPSVSVFYVSDLTSIHVLYLDILGSAGTTSTII